MLDFFCVADLCVDLILRGNVRPRFGQVEQLVDDYALELGGSATICAGQFVKLGGTAGVIGRVGDDALGNFITKRLADLAIDATHAHADPAIKTGIGVALAEPDDRAILTYLGSIDAIRPADLTPELLAVARHWHVASYFLLQKLEGAWEQWLKDLRTRGVTTSLDTNWAPDEQWDRVKRLLPLVDWFLPNENEAKAITGKPGLLDAGRELSRHGCGVAIKCGARGAVAFWRGEVVEAKGREVNVVDSTGAGDCFDAGFLRAWQLGWKLEKCLQTGVRCGTSSVQAAGGFAGQLRDNLR